MAINDTILKILFYSKTLGVRFDEVMMLGRQTLYATKEKTKETIEKYGTNVKDITEVDFKNEYSEPVFQLLGAVKIDSMDLSDYEKASIIHDLNDPVPGELKNKYSVVFDGGTLEHIFNFPVAIKNSMEMLKPGGHFIAVTPANNQMGHGFYQFSPELFYRIFSESNGFRMVKMLIYLSVDSMSHWYEVRDPKDVNSRVVLTNNYPVSLIVIAEKIKETQIFLSTPQQIDYVNTWNAHTSITGNKIIHNESRVKFLYRKVMPRKLKMVLRNVYDAIFKDKAKDLIISNYDPNHFIKTEI